MPTASASGAASTGEPPKSGPAAGAQSTPVFVSETENSDDEVATFSSRGPTLGCEGTDLTSCDLFIKPDIVAPGSYIRASVAPNSRLYQKYQQTHIPDSTTFFQLSGSSMAAPAVAGGIAVMLESNKSLTPNLVKAWKAQGCLTKGQAL